MNVPRSVLSRLTANFNNLRFITGGETNTVPTTSIVPTDLRQNDRDCNGNETSNKGRVQVDNEREPGALPGAITEEHAVQMSLPDAPIKTLSRKQADGEGRVVRHVPDIDGKWRRKSKHLWFPSQHNSLFIENEWVIDGKGRVWTLERRGILYTWHNKCMILSSRGDKLMMITDTRLVEYRRA